MTRDDSVSADLGLKVVREGAAFRGKQGPIDRPANSAEAVGSKAIRLQVLELPPGERDRARKHEAHEPAIDVRSGPSGCFWGARLEHHVLAAAGDFVHVDANVPHLPYNFSASDPVMAVIARTDPDEQESVVLLPELEERMDRSLAG